MIRRASAALALGALLALAGCASESARTTQPAAPEAAAAGEADAMRAAQAGPARAESAAGEELESAEDADLEQQERARYALERLAATGESGPAPPAPAPEEGLPADEPDLAADPYAERPGGDEPATTPAPRAPVLFRAPSRRPTLAGGPLRLETPVAIALACVRAGAVAPEPEAAVLALRDALFERERDVRGVFALARPALDEVDLEALGRQAAAERRDLLLVDVRADGETSAPARGYLLDVRGSDAPDGPAPRLLGLFERGEDGLAVSSGASAAAERDDLLALLERAYARLVEEVE